MDTIRKNELEQMMLIAQDTKKEFVYVKDQGVWNWHSRGGSDVYGPFDSFLSALIDAVEPYMNDDDNDWEWNDTRRLK